MNVEGRYINQATNKNYSDEFYNKGHLFPNCHANDDEDQKSTFTLTNVVPQAISFNGGSWMRMETCVACVMKKYCRNNNDAIEAFVVTGAQPSSRSNNKGINIPSVLYTAFCCYNAPMDMWLASAHWGDNVAEGKNVYMETKTLDELSKRMSSAGSFHSFPSARCPRSTTVAHFYNEINVDKNCHCPSQASTTTASTTTAGSPTTTASTTTAGSPTTTASTTTAGTVTTSSSPSTTGS